MLAPNPDRRDALPGLLRRFPDTKIGILLLFAALLPVIFIWTQALGASRDVAYWDELDSAIAFLLRLQAEHGWNDTVAQLFALTNEHRTVTSRLIFAASYALTGTVNFVAIGVIGNLFICGLCGLLIAQVNGHARRLRLAVLLAFLLFQLQHYENFFWSGSSIDHFQVVLLASASLVALVRPTWGAFIGATVLAILATFTLAHGIAVWAIGVLLLAWNRRWEALTIWIAFAAATLAAFFHNFAFNPGHHITVFSIESAIRIGKFWLTLLGAPLALGHPVIAPCLGVTLLGLLAYHAFVSRKLERWVVPVALWCVLSLLLIAVGRTELSSGQVNSRYYVLGAAAWALLLFATFDLWQDSTRPHRALLRALPLLVLFNVSANAEWRRSADSWIISRNRAMESYLEHGSDGNSVHMLYPKPARATELLERAECHGVYRMPNRCAERKFSRTRLVDGMSYYIDHIRVGPRIVAIEGWAAYPGRESRAGQAHLVLQSEQTRKIYATIPMERRDVAAAYPQEKWRSSGFRFHIRRWLLPRENFQLGLLIESERGPEFVMTAHRLDLTGEGRGILAGSD